MLTSSWVKKSLKIDENSPLYSFISLHATAYWNSAYSPILVSGVNLSCVVTRTLCFIASIFLTRSAFSS